MGNKMVFKKKYKDGLYSFTETVNYYRSKYFANFMNKFEIEGLSYDQKRFLLTQFWEKGTICAFILKGSKPSSLVLQGDEQNPNGLLVLTPYAPFEYNIYNYPTKVTLVKLRGATFIPSTPMIVGKECILGFAHTSHLPIRQLVEYYVMKIADVESAINIQVFTHKMPRLIVVSPEDKARMKSLVDAINDGDNQIYIDAVDYEAIKNVLDGGTYILDKLYAYKTALENELLTMLGIDNNGVDKRERRVVDEVNANNEIINDNNDCFMSEIDATLVDGVNNILKFPLVFKSKQISVTSVYEEDITNEDDTGGEDL